MLGTPLQVDSGDAGGRLEAFRRRHEAARADLVAAHVTLVFGATGLRETAPVDHAMACAAACPPIDLRFDAAQRFVEPGERGFKLFLMVGQGAKRSGRCIAHCTRAAWSPAP